MTDTRTQAEISAAEEKAAAEAASASVDAAKKQAEFDEWSARRAKRDADAATDSEALRLKNEDSRRAAIKDLIPDLSKVDAGSLKGPEQGTLFQSLLGGRALEDAAAKVAKKVKAALLDNGTVYVTAEDNITARDASALAVKTRIGALTTAVERFLQPTNGRARTVPGTAAVIGILPLGPLAAGIGQVAAGVLPGLLSLISAKRTLSTSTGTVDDDAAVFAVAGALALGDAGGLVVVEKAQVLGDDNPTINAWSELLDARQRLADFLDGAPTNDNKAQAHVAEGKALLTVCDAAIELVSKIGEDGRSLLQDAATQEALYSGRFRAVLLVKGAGASASQLLNDRPLMFNDTFSVVSSASISFLLVEIKNGSKVLSGGTGFGIAEAHGKIGTALTTPLIHQTQS